VSINFVKRVTALGAIALLAAAFSSIAPAGAATVDPAALATLTVTTTVQNAGNGSLSPDSFVYHVTRDSDGTDVLDGIFNHNGKTVIKLPADTYTLFEDPIEPYVEHVSSCASITLDLAQPKTCNVLNVWTAARITVSTTVDNAAGGSADPSSFTYHVTDTSNNKVVKTATFNKSGTSTIRLPDGTYTVTEDALNGYVEDVTSCVALTIDLADPASCIVNNVFDPHTTTTAAGSTTVPGSTQVTVHGAVTNTSACVLTLDPPLQPPTNTNITLKLSTDAFAQPHKGQPIKLSNGSLTVSTPASLLQTGVDLSIIKNGDAIPEKVTLVLDGDGTTEGSHTYVFSLTLHIVVKNGFAQPLVATQALPDTTWTPKNAVDPVFFSEHSLQLKSTISSPAIGSVTSIFTCNPPSAPTLIALSAQGGNPPTGGPGTTGGPGGGVNGSAGGGILPVTGTSVWLWLAPAVLLLSLGLFAIGVTARKRRRFLN
jgi:hypothetical protein